MPYMLEFSSIGNQATTLEGRPKAQTPVKYPSHEQALLIVL